MGGRERRSGPENRHTRDGEERIVSSPRSQSTATAASNRFRAVSAYFVSLIAHQRASVVAAAAEADVACL